MQLAESSKGNSFLINSYIVVATYLDMFSVSYSRQIFIAAWEKTCQKYSISAQIGQCLLCPITSPLSSHKILCIMQWYWRKTVIFFCKNAATQKTDIYYISIQCACENMVINYDVSSWEKWEMHATLFDFFHSDSL